METILNHLTDMRNSIANAIDVEIFNRKILDMNYQMSVEESDRKLMELRDELDQVNMALDILKQKGE